MKMLLSAIALTIGLAACTDQASTNATQTGSTTVVPAAPVADTSTPDRTVKSLWALLDWHATIIRAQIERDKQSPNEQALQKLWGQVAVPAIDEGKNKRYPKELIGRTILQANIETETRAVVIAEIKNETPIPPGATPNATELKMRSEGERVKYVLEKNGSAWQVAEVWLWTDYSDKFRLWSPTKGSDVPTSVYGMF